MRLKPFLTAAKVIAVSPDPSSLWEGCGVKTTEASVLIDGKQGGKLILLQQMQATMLDPKHLI